MRFRREFQFVLLLAAGTGALSMSRVECAEENRPLTEPGFYEKDGKKFERGLYAGGKNEMPEAHRKAGEKLAATVAPLDAQGKPSENGNIFAVAAGHSNPRAYFSAFTTHLSEKAKTGEVNPKLALVNSCQGGKMCQDWAAECRAGPPRLAGNARNAQVLFLLTSYHNASRGATESKNPGIVEMPFEKKMLKMKEDLKAILQAFAKACPQLKLAYLGCDVWRGNSGLEPHVYEEAFAFKWLIEDQIKGDPELAYEGPNRKVPWLGWGGYIWESNAPRERFVGDGVHPSEKGCEFVIGRWHEALSKDPTARPWYLKPGAKP